MAKKILVVDDEKDIVTYLSAVLKDGGYETVEASNGDEALEILEKEAIDMVTLDVSMPEKTGVKTFRLLRESDKWKSLPVLIITGVAPDFKRFISTRKQVPPPDGYLEKPVKPEDLIAEVKRLIG